MSRTITVDATFGGTKQITKEKFIDAWWHHAAELSYSGIYNWDEGQKLMYDVKQRADAKFEQLYTKEHYEKTA